MKKFMIFLLSFHYETIGKKDLKGGGFIGDGTSIKICIFLDLL